MISKTDIQTVLDALKTSAHYSIGYSERREAAITICEAALAEPEGEPSTVLRLIDTIKYLVGIAERGEGRKARDDELPEQFVLGYVKRLEEAIAEPSEPFSKVLQSATNYDGTWSALVTAPCWLPTGLPLFTHPASKPDDDLTPGWVRAADEEMLCAHIGVANLSDSYASAKAKLKTLIDWHVAVATDPAVNGGLSLQPSKPSQSSRKPYES